MLHNNKKESLVIFLFLAAILMVVDALAISRIYQPHGALYAVSIHFSIIAMLTALLLYRVYKQKNYRFSMLLLVMMAAAGPFGAGVCLLAAICYSYSSINPTPPDEWIYSLMAQDGEDQANILQERISLGLDDLSTKSGVEPFQDILNSGTMTQKQVAIVKISRYFQPQFAPLLMQATQDINAAVRVLAAASLAKIERNFMTGCMQLEKEQDVVPPDDKSWLKLARLYEEYINSGLVDEYSIRGLQEKLIKIYESYLIFKIDDEIKDSLARAYINNGQPKQAYKLLSNVMESGKNIRPTTLSLYTEALFYLGKFKEIRSVANNYTGDFTRQDKYGDDIEDTISLWKDSCNSSEKPQSILEENYAT